MLSVDRDNLVRELSSSKDMCDKYHCRQKTVQIGNRLSGFLGQNLKSSSTGKIQHSRLSVVYWQAPALNVLHCIASVDVNHRSLRSAHHVLSHFFHVTSPDLQNAHVLTTAHCISWNISEQPPGRKYVCLKNVAKLAPSPLKKACQFNKPGKISPTRVKKDVVASNEVENGPQRAENIWQIWEELVNNC